ncbi:MAG: type II toxin-antitoxin system HicB family antitoxin, partial [Lachnospiraceae bacterium]|nr:type II toxin-antitoxin system HicB family antitoxin [Lachnospiraceae bacterium]
MKFIYPAVFRRTENGNYEASFPDLAGCHAQGDTLEDAVEDASEAVLDWISVEME